MLHHVAPQCIAPLIVIATLNPSWGNMLGGVLAASFRPSWWLVVFPGLAITISIMAANLVGDALRDFLDPKLRRRIE
jgi:ABC-type dipeptide/oligopeptide/nickel transport system permease subunit